MRKIAFSLLLALFLWQCGQEGPVKLVSAPEQWPADQSGTVILDGVRANGIDYVGFWYDTIIRGGAKAADTLHLPSPQSVEAGFEPGSRHYLYLDMYKQKQHVQRFKIPFTVLPPKNKEQKHGNGKGVKG